MRSSLELCAVTAHASACKELCLGGSTADAPPDWLGEGAHQSLGKPGLLWWFFFYPLFLLNLEITSLAHNTFPEPQLVTCLIKLAEVKCVPSLSK